MPFRIEPSRDRKLYRLVKRARRLELPSRRLLYREGEEAAALYLVLEGHLGLVIPGERRTVSLVGPNELTGEEALLPAARRRYEAVAGEPTVVAVLEGPTVLGVLRTARHTHHAYLVAQQEDLQRARSVAGGASTGRRLAALLLELADRFGGGGKGGRRIPLRVTHRELAELIGAHRSTITTQLNEWLYEGVLEEGDPGWIVARPAALRDFAP